MIRLYAIAATTANGRLVPDEHEYRPLSIYPLAVLPIRVEVLDAAMGALLWASRLVDRAA